MKFTGTYTDDAGNQHIISYKDMHLIYNTDKIQWDMRFFPYSDSAFFAIGQGGRNGVLQFK